LRFFFSWPDDFVNVPVNGFSCPTLFSALFRPTNPPQARIVLYASNKSAVAQATIFAGFQYTPAAGNYASFYDDNRVGWSLHFDSEAQVGWWCG
jgi:hypothetical protein